MRTTLLFFLFFVCSCIISPPENIDNGRRGAISANDIDVLIDRGIVQIICEGHAVFDFNFKFPLRNEISERMHVPGIKDEIAEAINEGEIFGFMMHLIREVEGKNKDAKDKVSNTFVQIEGEYGLVDITERYAIAFPGEHFDETAYYLDSDLLKYPAYFLDKHKSMLTPISGKVLQSFRYEGFKTLQYYADALRDVSQIETLNIMILSSARLYQINKNALQHQCEALCGKWKSLSQKIVNHDIQILKTIFPDTHPLFAEIFEYHEPWGGYTLRKYCHKPLSYVH